MGSARLGSVWFGFGSGSARVRLGFGSVRFGSVRFGSVRFDEGNLVDVLGRFGSIRFAKLITLPR